MFVFCFFFRYIYEVLFVFILMEKILIEKMLNIIGFKDGDVIFILGL